MSEPLPKLLNLSRRRFVAATGAMAGGLVVGCLFPVQGTAATSDMRAANDEDRWLGYWVAISPDGVVSVRVEKSEMGQGIHTGLAMLVAEELEVPWEDIRVTTQQLAGPLRGVATGASSSIRSSWRPLRSAGVAVREMLIEAAAQKWDVETSTCVASQGAVHHKTRNLRAGYGELASAASRLPVPPPSKITFKANKDFRLLGRPVARLDIPDKVAGKAVFGIDVQVDGMLHAAPALCPYPGGELVSADREAALAVTGVHAIVPVPNGLAVVADHYWQARKGLLALSASFTGDLSFDSERYSEALHTALDTPGVVAHSEGDVARAFSDSHRKMSARYEVPFLAHAAMEPLNCTAYVQGNQCEIWAPTQSPSGIRKYVGLALDIAPEDVVVNVTLLGGGFGRRTETEEAVQAALCSRELGRPVKIIWSREDDTRNDFYRPACASNISAALDRDGNPTAISQHISGPWHGNRTTPGWFRKAAGLVVKRYGGPVISQALPDFIEYRFSKILREGTSMLVAGEGPLVDYKLLAQHREYSLVDCELRLGWWRSVAASQGTFFTESFVDELAHAAGQDPYTYRRRMLPERDLAVLDRAAKMAGWGRALPEGTGLGIAISRLFNTTVCQVAEVKAVAGELPRVEHVFCAVDCGQVINPDTVRAQMEGSIIFGISAALIGKITLREGRVVESNFHDYPLLGMSGVPEISVEILESTDPPGGVGEPGTPPAAPALTNAIFAATGQRIRKLPVQEAFLHQRKPASADGTSTSA